jgi:hypothetical protein
MVILTNHAQERINERRVPDPRTVKIKKATPKVVKQKGFGAKLTGDKVGFTFEEGYECYIYICKMDGENIIVLTAYKYARLTKPSGRRSK